MTDFMRQLKLISGLCCLALISHISLPQIASAGQDLTSDFDNYLKLTWGLVVVLGIILILYGLLNRRFSLFSPSANKQITIVEMRPLPGKKALCLVNIRGQDFLLGIGDEITTIARFPADSEENFADILDEATNKKL